MKKEFKAFGDHLAIEKINEKIEIASGFVESASNSQLEAIQKGKITSVSHNWEATFTVGDVVYYNKARAFDIKRDAETTETMIPVGSVVAVEPCSGED